VDPICTFLFSVLVILTTVAIIKDVVNVLMEGIPKGFEYSQVENTFMQIDGVVKVHNLRIWALSLDKTALSAHLAISKYARSRISCNVYISYCAFHSGYSIAINLDLTTISMH
jgi:Co/Zn/Cd efflux system component